MKIISFGSILLNSKQFIWRKLEVKGGGVEVSEVSMEQVCRRTIGTQPAVVKIEALN